MPEYPPDLHRLTKRKKTMKAYKGFKPDLTCRDFQYAEGKTYTQDAPAELCASGFHAVTAPLDVFNYYPPASSVYHEVKLSDVDEKREGDSKVAGRNIKIGVALGIPELVAAHVAFVMSNVKADAEAAAHTTTDRSAASSTGYQSAASSTGEESIAAVFGYDGKARGAKGNWIVLTDRDTNYHILDVKAFLVDGKTIKADTYYKLRAGKVVAA